MAGQFRGKNVLDVGSGYARQSFVFALHGASVTFLDVVPKNLERIQVHLMLAFLVHFLDSPESFSFLPNTTRLKIACRLFI